MTKYERGRGESGLKSKAAIRRQKIAVEHPSAAFVDREHGCSCNRGIKHEEGNRRVNRLPVKRRGATPPTAPWPDPCRKSRAEVKAHEAQPQHRACDRHEQPLADSRFV